MSDISTCVPQLGNELLRLDTGHYNLGLLKVCSKLISEPGFAQCQVLMWFF